MALLSVQNVSKTFKDHDYRVHAVRNASLEVHRGEMIAIIGPSGSGKTTLLNLMGIVVAPDSGEVYVDGQKASDMSDAVRCRIRNQYFGYIVQDFALIEEDQELCRRLLGGGNYRSGVHHLLPVCIQPARRRSRCGGGDTGVVVCGRVGFQYAGARRRSQNGRPCCA